MRSFKGWMKCTRARELAELYLKAPEVTRRNTRVHFLQGLDEMHAGVAACHFRSLQVQLGQFPRPAERLAVRHNFGNHSPFVCATRCQRLWVQQERLRSSRSSAIAPGGKDSVAGRNARGEVGHILEGRTIRRHNYTGK